MKFGFQYHVVLLAAGLAAQGCSKSHRVYSSAQDPAVAAQLQQFVRQKEAQAAGATNAESPAYAPFFAAAKAGDWLAVSNAFRGLRNQAGQYEHGGATDERLRGTKWQTVVEVWGAMDAFGEGDEKYSAAFGRDIVAAIPPGSIYFGGTDPGRFLVTAMCKSQVNGDPFFVLTQNALADATYLDYVRQMYGGRICIPDSGDSQRCFEEYIKDLQARSEKHQLKPGENFHTGADGRVQVAGQVSVMAINGLLAKIIFDQNPKAEFYLEESFPLDWMYPQLEPYGLIFKIDRQPMSVLPEEMVQADHDYWANYIAPMIGGWLRNDTSVAEVAKFGERVFGRHDFSGFKGDRHFVENAYAHKMYSKLRSSIAGLYAWRTDHAVGPDDRERMAQAADLAFRQAWALCPYSPEAIYRYVNFLLEQKRFADARIVAEAAAHFPGLDREQSSQFRSLAAQLKQYQPKTP